LLYVCVLDTIYGIKNTHIQQNRTDQPYG